MHLEVYRASQLGMLHLVAARRAVSSSVQRRRLFHGGWVLRRVPDEAPQDIVDLMERCMQMDPEVRPDAVGVHRGRVQAPAPAPERVRQVPGRAHARQQRRVSCTAYAPGVLVPRPSMPDRPGPGQAPARCRHRRGHGRAPARTSRRCGRSRRRGDRAYGSRQILVRMLCLGSSCGKNCWEQSQRGSGQLC